VLSTKQIVLCVPLLAHKSNLSLLSNDMNKKMHNTLSGSKIAVKFLLNQQDAETVDLEAKNMVLKLPHFFCI